MMKRDRRGLTLLLMLLFCGITLFAQQKKQVIGVVVDDQKEPVIGATVLVKGTKIGVITNVDGKYSIDAAPNATLVFSYVGYDSQEEKVNGRNVVNATLKEKAVLLNEVVAIGYGSTKRKDLTGSISKVDLAEVNKAPVPTLDQALSGRIAGLNIMSADGAPGSETQISIRGGSMAQDAQPLFIIDGFPMDNFDINTIDPKTIESIDVLKDASSIAIYGSRGANGVIIITSKQGAIGKPRVSYSYSFSLNLKPKMDKMMGAYDYVKTQLDYSMLRDNTGQQYNNIQNLYFGKVDPVTDLRPWSLENYRNAKEYDWQDLITRNSGTHNHSLSVNGGTADTKYNVNLGYVDQQGLVMNTGMQRYTAKGTLDQRISKSIKLVLSANHTTMVTRNHSALNNARSFKPVAGFGAADLMFAEIDPSLFDPDTGELLDGVTTSTMVSPLSQAENEQSVRTQGQTNLNAKGEWRFLKYFVFTPSVGASFTNTVHDRFYNSKTRQGLMVTRKDGTMLNTKGVNGNSDIMDVSGILTEHTLGYRQKYNKNHSLDALVGFSYQYSSYTNKNMEATNIPVETEHRGLYGLSGGTPYTTTYRGSSNQMASFFGRAQYTLMDRYLFTATARLDGSSKFAPKNQWGVFPSAAFAWRLSQEPFMRSATAVNDAKIRFSYGSVGNNKGVGDFAYRLEMGGLERKRQYMLDGRNLSVGISPYFYSNPDLKWESTEEFNIGTDWSLLDSRLNITLDAYYKVTRDVLMYREIPFYMGYYLGNGTRAENGGSVSNQGVELSISSVNIQNKKFSWTTDFNISYNKSTVLSLSNNSNVFGQAIYGKQYGNVWIAKVGEPITQFYGFISDGLYQESDFDRAPNGGYILKPDVANYQTTQGNYQLEPGHSKFVDLNGDGFITDADRTTLGTPIPDWIGGLSNTFSYGDWSLNLFFNFNIGNKILNMNRYNYANQAAMEVFGNMYPEYASRWTPENSNTNVPKMLNSIKGDINMTNGRISSEYIEDGSFLRLSTVSLIYALPKKLLKKTFLTDVRFNLSAQNLFVITKYSGQDPQVSNYAGVNTAKNTGYTVVQASTSYTTLTQGMDNQAYPRPIILNIGASVTF